MRAHMLKFHDIEVPPMGGSRRSTPVSMLGGTGAHADSPLFDSPTMVPRHVANARVASPGATPPIVIEPLGSEREPGSAENSRSPVPSTGDQVSEPPSDMEQDGESSRVLNFHPPNT